jgi:putative sigma-54 modulation protein
MQIEVTGQQMDVTDALKQYTIEKLSKLESHFKISSIHVVLKIEKLDQIAEATISGPKELINASSKEENMYTAIDTLTNRLKVQLVKHKEKSHANHRD